MAHELWVVKDDNTGLFLTNYQTGLGGVTASWGNEQDAITWVENDEQGAQTVATSLGGGMIHPIHQNPH